MVWLPCGDDGDDDDGLVVGRTSPDTHANELVFPSADRRLPGTLERTGIITLSYMFAGLW